MYTLEYESRLDAQNCRQINIKGFLEIQQVFSIMKVIFYLVRCQDKILTRVVLHLNWFINVMLAVRQ